MKKITYFKLEIKLLSPLSIGSSYSKDTDSDLLRDSRGRPVIPATSIAGVYRSLEKDPEKRKKYFGDVVILRSENKKEEAVESSLKFYDGQLASARVEESIRDGVKLHLDKTAKTGGKYDFQVVEPNAIFISYIEVIEDGTSEMDSCIDYVKTMLKKQVRFGAKTTRGYGDVSVSYKTKEFILPDQLKGSEGWLEFNMFESDFGGEWQKGSDEGDNDAIRIELKLKQKGGLTIRQYLTDAKEKADEKEESVASTDTNEKSKEKKELMADYGPLSLANKTPVIPGTSWSGMFRSHIRSLLGKEEKDKIEQAFGYVNEEEKSAAKSKITFSESPIAGAVPKKLTRNAIDRFTSGTKKGALYTEQTIYDGETNLSIEVKKDVSDEVKAALCATIIDLHEGFVAVGGLTAVGRGLFEIIEISVNEKGPLEICYAQIKEKVCDG